MLAGDSMARRFKKKKASAAERPPAVTVSQSRPNTPSSDWLWGGILVLAVIVVYLPVWNARYIWDDDLVVTGNPVIVGPRGLADIWTTRAADICPLTLTTFWVEHALWGLHPLPYHLVNVALQAGCAVLLWRVLLQLRVPGAWLGAAFWALHPVQVESVAWIAEMKNTESGLFFLLAVFFFIRWFSSNRRSSYWLMLFFSALAMASKSSTVILPLVFALCGWWLQRPLNWRRLTTLWPVFFLALVAGLVSSWTQAMNGAVREDSWGHRIAVAGEAVWFYLGKLIWPYPLITIYPRWEIDPAQATSYLPLLLLVLLAGFLWWKRHSSLRPVFFAFAYFIIALAPALGLVAMTFSRYSFVADHFQYLASIGPLALAAAGLVRGLDILAPRQPWLKPALAAALLLPLATLSSIQTSFYKNQLSLWNHTLAHNPSCWVAYTDIGATLLHQGHTDEAIRQLQAAINLAPDLAEPHNNLGNAWEKLGNTAAAIEEYRKALALNPHFSQAHYNLGHILARQRGHEDEVVAEYREALLIDPGNSAAHNGLGLALLQKGDAQQALAEFQEALRINPRFADAENNIGNLLLQNGQVDQAILHYQKALESDPGYAPAHNNLGVIFSQKGEIDEALKQFQLAAASNASTADFHSNLGATLLQKGRIDEAMSQFQQALVMDPNYADARYFLGTLFLRQGRLDEALDQLNRAAALHPGDSDIHNNLGLTLLRKGRTAEATAQFQEAVRLNPNNTDARNNLLHASSPKPPK